MGDDLRGYLGRINGRARQLAALAAALHLIEACWFTMTPEQRARARRWTGFNGWLQDIRRAVDWQ